MNTSDLDENSITSAVIETFAGTPDPRLRQLMQALVRHLHDFAREVRLTPDEWIAAIGFLTAVGHKCDANRQEFILLSDTLGLSSLVNLVNSPAVDGATVSSVLGPFYRENSREYAAGSSIAVNQPGEIILLEGRVLDTEGQPIAGATVDVWQASIEGAYDTQGPNPEEHDLRGRFKTDAAGRYAVRTVPPLGYSVPADGPVGDMLRTTARHSYRPSHIHFMVAAPGHRELVTALYLRDDDKLGYTGSDTVFGVSESLAVTMSDEPERRVSFDFVLLPAGAEGSVRVGADPAALVPAS